VIRRTGTGVWFGIMPHRLALPVLLTLVPLAYATSAHAAPDEICLPEASPTPDWWSPGLGPVRRELRWDGADVRESSNGTRHTRLRSIWSPQWDKIYIEVRVEGDNSLDPQDAFIMSISDAAADLPELYVELHPVQQCPVWSDCSAGVELDASSILYAEGMPTASSMGWGELSQDNPSTELTIHHPWVRTHRTGSTFTWTLSFAMTVPTTGGDFVGRRIYGNAVAYDPGFTSGTYYEMPVWCTSASPTTDTCVLFDMGNPELPEDLAHELVQDTWPLVEAGACVP
jgi:hypothetical protein